MASVVFKESPIHALEGNILWQFENLSKNGADKLQAEVEQGLIAKEIDLCMDAIPPRGPRLMASSNGAPIIDLHVPFLELLWAFVYGWMVIYEENIQRPQMPGTSRTSTIDKPLFYGFTSTIKQRALYDSFFTAKRFPDCNACTYTKLILLLTR